MERKKKYKKGAKKKNIILLRTELIPRKELEDEYDKQMRAYLEKKLKKGLSKNSAFRTSTQYVDI